jgi:hypothetical protein
VSLKIGDLVQVHSYSPRLDGIRGVIVDIRYVDKDGNGLGYVGGRVEVAVIPKPPKGHKRRRFFAKDSLKLVSILDVVAAAAKET